MCPKLFILKEFYFLILESNVEHIINIHPNELLNIKTKQSKINESLKKSASQLLSSSQFVCLV